MTAAAEVCRAELISLQFSLAVLKTRAAVSTIKIQDEEATRTQQKDPLRSPLRGLAPLISWDLGADQEPCQVLLPALGNPDHHLLGLHQLIAGL